MLKENRATFVSASCKTGNKICWYTLKLNLLGELQFKLTLRSSIGIHCAVWETNGATEKNQWQYFLLKKKVKCTLVQARRFCTGRTAYRGSRGIALPFHDHGTRRWWGQRHAPAAFYPRERPGTHCTGGYVGPRAGLDRCEKSRPHQDSIPSPYPVAIRTEISRPMLFLINNDWNTLILITPFY